MLRIYTHFNQHQMKILLLAKNFYIYSSLKASKGTFEQMKKKKKSNKKNRIFEDGARLYSAHREPLSLEKNKIHCSGRLERKKKRVFRSRNRGKMSLSVETREEIMKMSTEEAKLQRRERSWRKKEKEFCPEKEEKKLNKRKKGKINGGTERKLYRSRRRDNLRFRCKTLRRRPPTDLCALCYRQSQPKPISKNRFCLFGPVKLFFLKPIHTFGLVSLP